MAGTNRTAAAPIQKILVIDGGTSALPMLESMLGAGCYDMLFVESWEAYSQVKKVLPNLVVLCTRIGDMRSFHLLTMLTLDPDTRHIPMLTFIKGCEGQDVEQAGSQCAGDEEDLPSRFELQAN
ncbi:MAG: hypothetical protein HY655_05770 [Acidobacteria bacterium]|nr:hypothetical protein [Acidobacteriota bacterium]